MDKIILKYLDHLNIPVSSKYYNKLLRSHADYPSLLSIADSLEILGITCQVARISPSDLLNIEFPYVLHLKKASDNLILIKHQKDLSFNQPNLNNWSGVVIKIKPEAKIISIENTSLLNQQIHSKRLTFILIFALIILLFAPLSNSFSLINILLLISSCSGIAIGYILIARELGKEFKVIEAFCIADKKNICDSILKSNYVSLVGNIEPSDCVVTYFTTQAIMLSASFIFPNQVSSLLDLISILSFLSIPVIPISIYYQHITKGWCYLCLFISGILFFQNLIFFNFFPQSNIQNFFEYWPIIGIAVLLFFFVFSSLLLIKRQLKKNRELDENLIASNRIINSASVFLHLLHQQRKVDNSEFENELRIGNTNAPIKITMVSNLYCSPCKIQHEFLETLLKTYPDHVSVNVRLLTSEQDKNKLPTPSQYLLEFWLKNIHTKSNESENTQKLLREWYSLMDFNVFKEKYKISELSSNGGLSLDFQHFNWINQSQIYKTPTFFINGHELPNTYTIAHLLMLIPSLAELLNNDNSNGFKEIVPTPKVKQSRV